MFSTLLLLAGIASSPPSDAEAVWRAALEQARAFGEQDPRFASAAHGLGGILLDRGKNMEARRLLEAALPVLEASLGVDHRDVAFGRLRLAKVYSQLSRYSEAERLLVLVRAHAERVFGERDPLFNGVLLELGALYRSTGRCEESKRILLRAIEVEEPASGGHDLLASRSREQPGATYSCLGQYTQAIPLLRGAVAAFEKIPAQPVLASILVNLGNVYFTLGQLKEAEAVWQRALLVLSHFPELHIPKANILFNLGTLKLIRGRSAEAEPLILEALAVGEAKLEGSGDLAPILNRLADLYTGRKELDRAEKTYQRAVTIAASTLGPEDPEMAIILMGLGRLRIIQKRLDEAATFFEQALEIFEKRLGPRHPYYGKHLAEYATLLRKLKRKNEAKEVEARVRTIDEENRVHMFAGATVDVRELKKH